MIEVLSNFSETLEVLITEKGFNAKTFAEEIKVQPSTITRYLNKEQAPSLDSLVMLADYFCCTTDYLIGREETNSAKKFHNCPPFAKRLDELLKELKVSIKDFVKTTGISTSSLYEWLSGQRVPSFDNLIKIADRYHCSLDFVLGREA